MPRRPKPYLHRGWYVTNIGGVRHKLCPEADGPDGLDSTNIAPRLGIDPRRNLIVNTAATGLLYGVRIRTRPGAIGTLSCVQVFWSAGPNLANSACCR